MRVKFLNGQRKFLDLVLERLMCRYLKDLLQYGFSVKFSALRNYYSERRMMPKKLVVDLCYIAKINFNELEVEELKDNWGRVKGGKSRN